MQTRIQVTQMKGEYLWDSTIIVSGHFIWSPAFTYHPSGGTEPNPVQIIDHRDGVYIFCTDNLLEVSVTYEEENGE